MATYLDIVNAAKALYENRDKYCYFYGAKGQVLTDSVMNALWNAEPAYFSRYTAAQKTAIFNYSRGKIGLDCSAFVCQVLQNAGLITKGQWTYSTALIGKCTNVTNDPASAASPAGSLLYSSFHNAGRHIGVDGGAGCFYDIAAEGGTINKRSIAGWGKWEKAGRWPGVDYSGAFSGSTEPTAMAVPEGYLDVVTATSVSGWAYDGTDTSLDIHVYILKDGATLSINKCVANNYRADLEAAGKGNGSHGFTLNYDFAAKHGAGTYLVRAYAINMHGKDNPLLKTEKYITVAAPSNVYGTTTTGLNVRTKADPTSKIVVTLAQGEAVNIRGTVKSTDGGTWYSIICRGSISGYVNSKYIKK